QRDRQRLQDVADIRRALEQFRVENGRYPALPSGAGWGQCSGGIPTNWIPDRADFNWSRRYLERMPREPRTACYYPFDPAHVGNAQYMYFSDGPHRYALIVGLEDPSLPGTLRGRGAASVPPWLLRVAGSADKWWGGTYVVTSESSEAMAQQVSGRFSCVRRRPPLSLATGALLQPGYTSESLWRAAGHSARLDE